MEQEEEMQQTGGRQGALRLSVRCRLFQLGNLHGFVGFPIKDYLEACVHYFSISYFIKNLNTYTIVSCASGYTKWEWRLDAW